MDIMFVYKKENPTSIRRIAMKPHAFSLSWEVRNFFSFEKRFPPNGSLKAFKKIPYLNGLLGSFVESKNDQKGSAIPFAACPPLACGRSYFWTVPVGMSMFLTCRTKRWEFWWSFWIVHGMNFMPVKYGNRLNKIFGLCKNPDNGLKEERKTRFLKRFTWSFSKTSNQKSFLFKKKTCQVVLLNLASSLASRSASV